MMVLNQFEITNNIDNVLITIFTRSLYMLTTMVLRRVLIHNWRCFRRRRFGVGQNLSEPKELYVVPGARHIDLYDDVNVIPFDKLASFFSESLK